MALLEREVQIKWNVNNKRWYVDKGYTFTKVKQTFTAKVEDLSHQCSALITPICDICEEQRETQTKYYNYSEVINKNNGVYICPKCSKSLAGRRKRKSNEDFLREVFLATGDEYEFLEEYVTANRKIKIRHICENCNNHEYEVKPAKFLIGERCPKCANNIKKTLEEFKREINNRFGEKYTILGEVYINTDTPIRVRHNCSKCNNYEWDVVPKLLLKGESKCPKCSKKARKSTEDFKEEIFNLVGEEYTVLSPYKRAKDKIIIRHNSQKCNSYEYEITPTNFLTGKRCPLCCQSKGEERISRYLLKNNIEFSAQKEYSNLIGLGGGNLSYDFYLSKYNLLIEYQGEQHEKYLEGFHKTRKDFEKQQEHDKLKKEYAENHNIQLLEIWHWDFENIEKILNEELNLNKVA